MARTKVEVALGDVDYGLDPDQYDWTDWTDAVEREQIGVTTFRGYRGGSAEPSATEIRFRGKNADRRWSIWSAANPYYGEFRKRTPVRVSRDYGAAVTRATAYVKTVTLGNEAGGAHKWADVEAVGRLDFEESQEETQSVLYQQLADNPHVVGYWPGEDESGSPNVASAIASQRNAGTLVGGIALAADSEILGSKSLWQITDADGALRVGVTPYRRSYPEEWAVLLVVKIPEEPAGTQAFFGINCETGAVIKRWILQIVPGAPAALQIQALNDAGANVLTGTTTVSLIDENDAEPWGRTIGLRVCAKQNGADVDWSVHHYVTHTVSNPGSGATGTVAAHALAPISGMSAGTSAGVVGWTFGHWTIMDSVSASEAIYFNGYNGEDLALSAFTVAINADWPPHFTGSTITTSTGGPLGTDSAASKLKKIMRSEGGLLYETAGGLIRPMMRAELTSQTVDLTTNYNDGKLFSLVAIEDSLLAANRIAATSDVGGSATADAPAPYDPASVGWVNEAPLDTVLQDVVQLGRAAQFEAAQQSDADYRYAMSFEFDGPASSLRSTYLADVDVGSRVQVTNPPTDVTLDTIDQQVMGITEQMTEQSYFVTLNTRSANVWQAFIAENGSANLSRADTSGSVLLAPIVAADTALLVGTRGNPGDRSGKWSTTSLPYDLALRARDRVTCTAVTNRTPTFIAAGTAVHADNAAVTPGAGAGITAGDLDLLFCSIRDSTGFAWLGGVADDEAILVGDQLGWKRLAEWGGANGNTMLLARTFKTGDADPVLTPVVGSSAAGDTVSAQRATVRYVQPVLHTEGIPLINASAANVAYPGCGIVRPNTFALIVAQKDDDWTSVASPAGWTEIGEPDSTSGTDQGLAWYYQIQTTATNIAAGSLVVTGGASAISKATSLCLIGDVQTLTCTRGVNGAYGTHPAGSDVRLWRAGRLTR